MMMVAFVQSVLNADLGFAIAAQTHASHPALIP
jgi:hypothetical protein